MSEWEIHKVANLEKRGMILVQDGNHGEYRPRKDEFVDQGVAFIRAAAIANHEVQFASADKINSLAFKRIRKGIGSDLDTILSTKGTVGKIAFVPKGSPSYVCSPQTTFWRSLDHSFLDPKFLFYELQSDFFCNQSTALKGDTDMADYLSLTSQRSLSIRVPNIDDQQDIVRVLSALDIKTQTNHQIKQTLEHIAQVIFKNWFVDFEPVKAKQHICELGGNDEQTERAAQAVIAGAVNLDTITIETDLDMIDQQLTLALSEKLAHQTDVQRQQLVTAASHFPTQLVESELGLIPEGWEVRSLDKIAEFLNGVAAQKYPVLEDELGLPVIKITEMRGGLSDKTGRSSSSVEAKYIVKNGDLLFSWSGSLMVQQWSLGEGLLNQHIFKVTSDEFPKWFYHQWICYHLKTFKQIAADKAVTMGHIKRSHLSEAKTLVPNKNLLAIGTEVLGAMFEKELECALESQNLIELRNLLLPKLLSGSFSLDGLEDE